jgi:hypothetical protein
MMVPIWSVLALALPFLAVAIVLGWWLMRDQGESAELEAALDLEHRRYDAAVTAFVAHSPAVALVQLEEIDQGKVPQAAKARVIDWDAR